MKIGIDAGGTLIKVVYDDAEGRVYYKIPTREIEALIADLNENHPDAEYYITGGGAERFKAQLAGTVFIYEEFDATFTGLQLMLKEQDLHLDSFVYLNVGTGTSIHYAENNQQQRIGGSGVGGGTLLGLSQLLVGSSDFDEVIALSKEGNRDHVDLKVKHIYGDAEPPIPGDFTASNFAYVLENTTDISDADKVQAVVGLVAETVMTIGLAVAERQNISDIVFIGSTFNNNDVMRDIIKRYGELLGARPHIIENGEFSGALGAIYV